MRRTSLAIAASVAFAASASAEGLTEARWLAPEADRVKALTLTPGECLAAPADAESFYRVEIGRAAFMSPLLMGGQAARSGLSCAACHVDGHANPDFFLAGLSGAPGTADVTTSVFSEVREDGEFNPLPIPSLIDAGKKTSFGTHAPAPSLHDFIGAAIVEEFQAEPPPANVLAGLIAYVGALDAAACPEEPMPLTARRAMRDAARTLETASVAFQKDDQATADFLLASSQVMLGRISERFPGEKGARLRSDLGVLSRDIGAVRQSAEDAVDRIAEIRREAARLEKRLHRARRFSLYDPDALAEFLERREGN